MLVSVKEHKIVVVGPRKVGKTALVVRFLTKRFICEYVENSDMSWIRETTVEGEQVKVNIKDTSDNGMTSASIELHFQWADAVLLIYSITDSEGFDQVKMTAMQIMDKIANLDEKEQTLIPPLVLVGNKGDLEFARKVSRQDGFDLSRKLRCEFFETSAREGWSKLLSLNNPSPAFYSSSSDFEFNSANEMTRSKSYSTLFKPASPKRGTSPSRGDQKKLFEKDKSNVLSRFDENKTPRIGRRSGRSFSVAGSTVASVPALRVSKTVPRLNSFPVPSTFSEEDSDDTKSNHLTLSSGRKLSAHERLIGRLSPRLGRKLIKPGKTNEQSNNAKDNNNNQHLNPPHDRMSFESRTRPEGKFNSIPDETRVPQITICCHSTSSSSANSVYGSSDSLLACDHDKDDRVSYKHSSHNPPQSPPEVFSEFFSEHEFTSSEPFLFVCRTKQSQQPPRPRSRSPSHRIMSGLKKIRSLASDHSNGQGNSLAKHQSNSTLTLPTLNYTVQQF